MLLRIADQGIVLPHRLGEARQSEGPLANLAAVFMLAGSLKANVLRRATGRLGLELPVGANRRVMDAWREQLTALAESNGLSNLNVRIIVDPMAGLELGEQRWGPLRVNVESDPADYRGTGGLLRDLVSRYDDDQFVLVCHAGQLLFAPLPDMVDRLLQAKADVALLSQPDGAPSGIKLMRCGSLRAISPVGFVDLNEQAMPKIAERFDAKVVRWDRVTGRTLRSAGTYLEALRAYHLLAKGQNEPMHPLAEDWKSSYSIMESGSLVSEKAVIHDSVVLQGSRVESGAVVARSIICQGVNIRRGQHVIDRVVTPEHNGALVF